jgi:hypothetical protein
MPSGRISGTKLTLTSLENEKYLNELRCGRWDLNPRSMQAIGEKFI